MIITDTAVHEVDVTRWLLGEEIVRATVLTRRARPAARARACATRSCSCSRPQSGRLVDVEAFVTAGYGYDIRCEVVGEDGTLELLPPPRRSRASAFTEALPLPPGFEQRFEAAYLHELQALGDAARETRRERLGWLRRGRRVRGGGRVARNRSTGRRSLQVSKLPEADLKHVRRIADACSRSQ